MKFCVDVQSLRERKDSNAYEDATGVDPYVWATELNTARRMALAQAHSSVVKDASYLFPDEVDDMLADGTLEQMAIERYYRHIRTTPPPQPFRRR